jgi:hypothetical protein
MTPRRRAGPTRPLSDLDQRILALLSRHRVITQNQLAAIVPDVPARTLRYRCARLAHMGLAGRSRPYRERGSAPSHLWPTRRGEAIVAGGPSPRGGERREPNPLFLAHAAGLSEVYVALATGLPEVVALARFEREGEAREPFAAEGRRERAIAPDAFIEITDRTAGPCSPSSSWTWGRCRAVVSSRRRRAMPTTRGPRRGGSATASARLSSS